MKEKDLVYKLWWLNVVGVIILFASLVMLIVTPLLDLPDGYEALWATTFTSSVNSIRKEGQSLLDVFVAKFKKVNGIQNKSKKKK